MQCADEALLSLYKSQETMDPDINGNIAYVP